MGLSCRKLGFFALKAARIRFSPMRILSFNESFRREDRFSFSLYFLNLLGFLTMVEFIVGGIHGRFNVYWSVLKFPSLWFKPF